MANNKQVKKEKTLYDIYGKQTAKGFNYPKLDMVSDGDIATYLKSIKQL